MTCPTPRRPLLLLRSAMLLAFAVGATALGDTASHRRAAAEVLDVVNTPQALRTAIHSAVGPLLQRMRAEGAPDAALYEIRSAMYDWAEKEIVWAEIKDQIVDIYVREFSEEELKALLAFYRTPAGVKALNRFPAIFAEGSRIGQAYAESKQALLTARLEQIADKYRGVPKTTAASR